MSPVPLVRKTPRPEDGAAVVGSAANRRRWDQRTLPSCEAPAALSTSGEARSANLASHPTSRSVCDIQRSSATPSGSSTRCKCLDSRHAPTSSYLTAGISPPPTPPQHPHHHQAPPRRPRAADPHLRDDAEPGAAGRDGARAAGAAGPRPAAARRRGQDAVQHVAAGDRLRSFPPRASPRPPRRRRRRRSPSSASRATSARRRRRSTRSRRATTSTSSPTA